MSLQLLSSGAAAVESLKQFGKVMTASVTVLARVKYLSDGDHVSSCSGQTFNKLSWASFYSIDVTPIACVVNHYQQPHQILAQCLKS